MNLSPYDKAAIRLVKFYTDIGAISIIKDNVSNQEIIGLISYVTSPEIIESNTWARLTEAQRSDEIRDRLSLDYSAYLSVYDSADEYTNAVVKDAIQQSKDQHNATLMAISKEKRKLDREIKQENGQRLSSLEINQGIEEVVDFLNKKFTHVLSGGKNYVVRKVKNNLENTIFQFIPLKDFVQMWDHHDYVLTGYDEKGGKEIRKNIAWIWLRHPKADTCFDGITFYPKEMKYHKGKLNSYFGLSVKPKAHTELINKYLDHIKNIICCGNEIYYKYLIGWISHMFQKPEEKPNIAVILHGAQGTGKGFFVDTIGELIGSHYAHITDPDGVLGKFNSQLENLILLFADEYFGGSKAASDKTKGIITEKTAWIERKGVDKIPVPSFTRVIFSTNHDNVIRIDKNERRYFYLEVSDEKMQNAEYFKELRGITKQEGFFEQLLNFFLTFDISDFDPYNAPKTEALNNQKIDNLEPMDKWIYDVLQRGYVSGESQSWTQYETKQAFQDSLRGWLQYNKQEVWGDIPQKIGWALKGLAKPGRKTINGKRQFIYSFGTLGQVRAAFEKKIRIDIDWD